VIRGTRRPGGAGRSTGRKGGGGRGGKGGGGTKSSGCLVLVFAGSTLMLGSGIAGLVLAVIGR
jgi:hypothetical protein